MRWRRYAGNGEGTLRPWLPVNLTDTAFIAEPVRPTPHVQSSHPRLLVLVHMVGHILDLTA